MLERKLIRCLLPGLIVPGVALALGLGDIHLKSALNSPLDAEIDVTDATAEDLTGLNAALASRESFNRYGLDYPSFLGNVRMQVGKAADGRAIIRVQSTESVSEPFATLLVDVNWARGHLVREYTVLVDPPVFTPAASSGPVAVAAPVTGGATRSGSVERSPSPAPVAEPAAANAGAAAETAHRVRPGETLSGIVQGAYGAAERERGLVAIYRANPSAFERNMNELRAGALLQIPADAELGAIGPAEAAAEVRRQYMEWNQGRSATGGQLRLVPPEEAGAATGGTGLSEGTSSAGGGALQQRVNQLETQLAEQRRLVEMRNAELAELQRRLGEPATQTAEPPAAVPEVPAPPVGTTPAPAETPEATVDSEPAVVAAPAETAVAEPAKPAVAAAPKTGKGTSFTDWLIEHWYAPLGLLVALLAGFLGLRAWRERKSVEFDRSLDRLSSTSFETAPPPARRRQPDTATLRALPGEQEQSFVVEESGTHEQPRISPKLVHAEPAAIEIEDTVSGDTAMPLAAPGLGEGDPLTDADFHMAYGLYDQAADLIKMAISREPQRRDLKLKLLEIYFVWGNREDFLAAAREIDASRSEAQPGEWEKIVIMGRQIAADDPLFAGSGPVTGAVHAGVDLNLEGGQNRVDFNLLGEPSVTTALEDAVDLDLSAALGDENTGETASLVDTGVDFVLDDPQRGAESTGITREMPGQGGSQAPGATAEMPTLESAFGDAPTVEQPQLDVGEHSTIRQKLESRGDLASADHTKEVEIDELGLDLGVLGAGEDEVSFDATSESPTLLASLDDTVREHMAAKDAARDETKKTAVDAGLSESGTWLFTDNDLASMLPAEDAPGAPDAATQLVTQITPRPAADIGMTSKLSALQMDGMEGIENVDLDLGAPASLDATAAHKITADSLMDLDLDLGASAPADADTGVETQRLSADQTVSDIEPATMSEVGTKLDLARAYMDMGDPEGARSILDEVLNEGSVSQKQEARRLIDSLPG
jgi:pilus assembly protein FimV